MVKSAQPSTAANHIAVFQETSIRRVWHGDEWWFAIVDVVSVLTDSVQPEGYVKDLRRRDPELAKGWGQIATPLQVKTAGGAQRVNCANTEGLFRIIQSIPSPKAEPFKRWLAQVGYERVKEIELPGRPLSARLAGRHKSGTSSETQSHRKATQGQPISEGPSPQNRAGCAARGLITFRPVG